jgi:APA family basic amino acid/polyamine antiporter
MSEQGGPDNRVQLERKLGTVSATAIVVANMIGAGIFVTSGLIAAQLPSPGWVLICWFFGGLIAISGALCYAELSTRMPQAGGEYVYLKRLYHPVLGFLTGWTSFFVGFSAPIAASARGFAEYIFAGLDSPLSALSSTQVFIFKKATAISIILIFTFIHYLGLRFGSRVQNALTLLKILIVFGLAAVGILFGKGDFSNVSFEIDGAFSGLAFGTSMMLVMFAYSGWNASSYIAGELKQPRRTLPISLVAGTCIVIGLYLALNLFIFHAVPYAELNVPDKEPTIAIVEEATVHAFGGWTGNVLGLLIALGLLSSLSAFIMIGPRVYYAMAKDRLFFPFASKVHSRYRVPGWSIVLQGATAVLMVMVGTFEQLLIYIMFALNIFPWLAIFGIFIARRRGVGEESVAKVWGYPVLPVFFLLSSLVIMAFNYMNRPLESSAAVVTVILGVPIYYLWRKGVGRKNTAG